MFETQLLEIHQDEKLHVYLECYPKLSMSRIMTILTTVLIALVLFIIYFVYKFVTMAITGLDGNQFLDFVVNLPLLVLFLIIVILMRNRHNYVLIHKKRKSYFHLRFGSILLQIPEKVDKDRSIDDLHFDKQEVSFSYVGLKNIENYEFNTYQSTWFKAKVSLTEKITIRYNDLVEINLPSAQDLQKMQLTPIRFVIRITPKQVNSAVAVN